MRLRKGDNVEVMNKAEKPLSWRLAQILSGNGHTYCVQYCNHPGMAGKQIETVCRKFVRPGLPPAPGMKNHNVGNVVEVFHEYAWKVATVLKVLEGKREVKRRAAPTQGDAAACNQCLVRLLGCSLEVVIDESNIRMRQSWHDGQWILIGKSSRGGEDVIVSRQSTADFHDKNPQHNVWAKMQPQKDVMSNQKDPTFWDSRMVTSRSLKRMSPYSSSIFEAYFDGHIQKLRAIEKDGGLDRMVAARGEISGNKNLQRSFKIGHNQIEKAGPYGVLNNSRVKNSGNKQTEMPVLLVAVVLPITIQKTFTLL